MSDNPYTPPVSKENESDENSSGDVSTAKATYNVVSDTVTGVNFRASDNKFQAKFIAVSVLLLALAGAVVALLKPDWELPWIGGAIIGAFVGLVGGLVASGIVLMVYRASRHMSGKHD